MTTVSPELIQRIEDKILEVLLLLQKRYNVTLEIPKYSFKQLGVRGGVAYYRDYRIELNSDFLKNHADEIINQTLPHEIAHLVAFKVYGFLGKGHGQFWKSVMYALQPLGVKVSRCHTYSLEGVKHRKVAKPYEYVCKCKDTIKVTANIHKKIQILGQKRRCLRCYSVVVLKSSVPQLKVTNAEEKEEMYNILGGDPIFAQQAS